MSEPMNTRAQTASATHDEDPALETLIDHLVLSALASRDTGDDPGPRDDAFIAATVQLYLDQIQPRRTAV